MLTGAGASATNATAAGPRQSLSDLLAGVDLAGCCWCYTDLGDGAGFSVPPGEDAYVHAVLDGSVRLAAAGSEMLRLGPGSAVIVLSGEAHALRTCANGSAATHPLLRANAGVDVPPTLALIDGPDQSAGTAGNRAPGNRIAAHILSGRLQLSCPADMDRSALPAIVRVGQGSASGKDDPVSMLRPQALALAGIGPGSAALLTRLAALMLVAALRTDPRCRRILAPARHDPIAEALGLIERQPAADWTVASLAQAVGLGRSNFAAQFTRAVGKAPMEVLVDRRMRQAAALLRDGSLKIAAIGEIVGYGSEAAFSRRFARHFGMTASHVREQAREQARWAAHDPATQAPPGPVRLLGKRTVSPATPAAESSAAGKADSPPPVAPARASSLGLLMMGARPVREDDGA